MRLNTLAAAVGTSHLFDNRYSMESIAFQGPGFLNELTEIYEPYAGNKHPSKSEIKDTNKAILDCIEKWVGIQYKEALVIDEIGWATSTPRYTNLDIHGEKIPQHWKKPIIRTKGYKIDYKRARIVGDTRFFELMFIWSPLWIYKGMVTPIEAAAATIHECGHVFNHLEYGARLLRTNQPLFDMAVNWNKATDAEERIILIGKAAKEADLQNLDPKLYGDVKDLSELIVIFNDASFNQHRSEIGTIEYDYTMDEHLADVFTARFGAGVHIASFISRMSHMYKDSPGRAVRGALFASIMTTVLIAAPAPELIVAAFTANPVIASVLLAVIVSVVFITTLASSVTESRYDGDRERIQRMVDQMTLRLKDKSIPREMLKTLTEEVRIAQELADNITNERSTSYWFAKLLSSKARARERANIIHGQFEALAYNRLILSAAELRAL